MAAEPVNLLVNPGNEAESYAAKGSLIVDDGLTPNVTDRQNSYDYYFQWDGTTMLFSIYHRATATKDVDESICTHCISMNDRLNKLVVYAADEIKAAMDLPKVLVEYTDGSQVELGYGAKYDDDTK